MENPRGIGRIFANIGSMFSSKTEEAMRQARIAHKRGVLFFKPAEDTRQDDPTVIMDHNGNVLKEIRATIVKDPREILDYVKDQEVIIIDEGQFFPPSLAGVMAKLYLAGKEVFYFGLDLTWRGELWPTTAAVLSLPDYKLTKHRGYCELCKNHSTMSQLIDSTTGQPVSIKARQETVRIGGKECFRALCLPCWLKTTPDAHLYFHPKDLEEILKAQECSG